MMTTTTADILRQRAADAAAAAAAATAERDAAATAQREREQAAAAAAQAEAERVRAELHAQHWPHYWPAVRAAALAVEATEQDADNVAAMLNALGIELREYEHDVTALQTYLVHRHVLDLPAGDRNKIAGMSNVATVRKIIGQTSLALRERDCPFLRPEDRRDLPVKQPRRPETGSPLPQLLHESPRGPIAGSSFVEASR